MLGLRSLPLLVLLVGCLVATQPTLAAQQRDWAQTLPYLPPELVEPAYPDAVAVMAPPIQRTDRLMVRWPGIIYANAVVVLMYHAVEPFATALPHTISTKQFQEHLRYLHDEGYYILTHRQFVDFVLLGKPVPWNSVLITFDDGYQSFYDFVYPLLQKWSVPATNFIILANTEHKNTAYHQPTLEWRQIVEMEKSGLVRAEVHSYMGHQYVRRMPNRQERPWYMMRLLDKKTGKQESDQVYFTRISEDMYRARTLLERRLGGNRVSMAYPYGARDATTDAAANLAGLQVMFTVRAGIVTRKSDPNALPRINGGSPAVPVAELDTAIRKAVMGKRYTRFELSGLHNMQKRGGKLQRLSTCCRLGPPPER